MVQRKQDPPSAFSAAVHAEIRGWMGRRNISQRMLGELAGIPKSTLSRLIGTNVQPLNLNELEAICKVLGVSPQQVVLDAERTLLTAQRDQANKQRPGGRYNKAGEWVPETRAGYALAAYDSDEEKGVDYDD